MCLVIVSIVEKKNWFYSVIFSLFQTLPTNGSRFQHATWWSKGMGLRWRYLFYFFKCLICFSIFIFLFFRPSILLSACSPVCLSDADYSQKWPIGFQILCLQWRGSHDSKMTDAHFFVKTFISQILDRKCP